MRTEQDKQGKQDKRDKRTPSLVGETLKVKSPPALGRTSMFNVLHKHSLKGLLSNFSYPNVVEYFKCLITCVLREREKPLSTL